MRGRRIAILESRLGEQLADLIAQRGAQPFRAPALAELPDLDPVQIGALVRSLQSAPPKLAVFQTGVGTRALFAATDQLGLTDALIQSLSQAIVAVRGPKPTAALRSRKVRIDRSAADPFTTHEVLALLADIPLKGERVIVQRFGVTNMALDEALQAAGATIIEIPTYRWSLPADTGPLEALVGGLERGEIDAAVFTNAEQVRNLFAVADTMQRKDPLRAALNATLVASIGPVASAALRDAGVTVGIEASPPKLGALMAALEAAFR
jgi:uroporphyrinogen-III synthase